MLCLLSQISTATSMKEKMAKKGSRELFLMCSPFQAAVSLQELPTLIQIVHFSPGAVQPRTKLHPVKRTSASQARAQCPPIQPGNFSANAVQTRWQLILPMWVTHFSLDRENKPVYTKYRDRGRQICLHYSSWVTNQRFYGSQQKDICVITNDPDCDILRFERKHR